ncbi:MAG: hypothetical protein AVDCRST_MAG59-2023, partial [uncultured Thermomicrobiales bacterium]
CRRSRRAWRNSRGQNRHWPKVKDRYSAIRRSSVVSPAT